MDDAGENPGAAAYGGGDGDGADVPSLADDRLYRALASTRRRRLLYALLAQPDGESTIDELAATLTGWATTETGGMATPDDYETILVALRHADLPKLAADGLIDYDSATGTVVLEPLPESVATLVRDSVASERDR